MTTGYNSELFVIWRRYFIPFIAFFVVLGVHTGVLLSSNFSMDNSCMIYGVFIDDPSFVGVLVVSLLPFLLCVLCLHLQTDYLIPIVLLVKGISFGFVSCLIAESFGSAGWLIHFMLLGVRQIQYIVLIAFALRVCGKTAVNTLRTYGVYFIIHGLLFCLEFFVLNPLVSDIL